MGAEARMAKAKETLGGRIKRLREESGYTQAELAEAAGVPVDTLRNWEYDRREPLASAICRLAEALGITSDELLGCKPVEG